MTHCAFCGRQARARAQEGTCRACVVRREAADIYFAVYSTVYDYAGAGRERAGQLAREARDAYLAEHGLAPVAT